MAAAAPLTTLINDEGVPLSAQPTAQRLPVFAAHYSRSAVMTLMLSELLAQALMQINSIAQRSRMPNAAAPRRLRAIILTLPSAMPKPEREIFRRRMQEAIGLVWKASTGTRRMRRSTARTPASRRRRCRWSGTRPPAARWSICTMKPGELRRPHRRLFRRHGPARPAAGAG